jgi:hypothetical protein
MLIINPAGVNVEGGDRRRAEECVKGVFGEFVEVADDEAGL